MKRGIARACTGLASVFMALSLGLFLLAAVLRRSRRDTAQSTDAPGPGEHGVEGMSAPAPAVDVAQPRAASTITDARTDRFDCMLADVIAAGNDRTIFRLSARGEPDAAIILNRDGGRA